jgi:hypothetical protein
MDELLQTNIFFYVTSAAVILLTIFWVVISFYIFKIVKEVQQITHMVKEESAEIAEDLGDLRESIKQEGFKLWHLLSFMTGRKARRSKRKTGGSAE